MSFLKSGFFQDGLKMFIYLIPLFCLIGRKKALRFKYFWLMFAGLFLLFFGHLLDFFDEFKCLEGIVIVGGHAPLHDFFEDFVGFTLGFAVFILALCLEFHLIKRK